MAGSCPRPKPRRASASSSDRELQSRSQRRALVARSWCGSGSGYGALAEEDDEPTARPAPLHMPSIKDLVTMARRRSSSTTALNVASTAVAPRVVSAKSVTALPLLREPLRKCNTALALSSTMPPMPPLRPVNRLRLSASQMCSRCSSILSMASSSRYSIDTTGYVAVRNGNTPSLETLTLCKLCLNEVPPAAVFALQHCSCAFCRECMRAYVEFEIVEGAYEISCPDALCDKRGVITLAEIEHLVNEDHFERHKRFRLNREVEVDKSRTWCPRAGCETVCTVCTVVGGSGGSGGERCAPQPVTCPTCDTRFCSACRAAWHAGQPCRPQDLAQTIPGVSFDSELIKCCPMCSVPIEKDEGCAQMMCKRCKHVFCWYCLASLDDDFLLRHYDKGPCKNKLGHSRASVIWHRTQVIGIFAGFGILLLVASPLLLLAAPCIVCCKCRVCSGGPDLDPDADHDPEAARTSDSRGEGGAT